MWARLEVVEKQINVAVISDRGQEKATWSKSRSVPCIRYQQPVNMNVIQLDSSM